MGQVRSKDGTAIAFERRGAGPGLILVDGALCYREVGPGRALATALAQHFTVLTYDRRGRGQSGDGAHYAAEREVEDIEALIDEAGGATYLLGHSSGAALALDAAQRGAGVEALALYEAPLIVGDSRRPVPGSYRSTLAACIAADRRGDAVRLFMGQVGLPAVVIALLRVTPMWKKLTGIAHTLVYDATILDGLQGGEPLPTDRWDGVSVPTVVAVGQKSPAWFHEAGRALVELLPDARLRVIPGQRHNVKAKPLAPMLVEFFGAAVAVR